MTAPIPDAAASGPSAAQLCKRCKENPGILNVRTEYICSDCFDKYLRSKCIKRMENHRVRYGECSGRKLLLPISFGISSTTLLHFIDNQLKNQLERVGNYGYDVLIVYVDESILDPDSPPRTHLELVKARFPDAGRYIAVGIEDIYNYKSVLLETLAENGMKEVKIEGSDPAAALKSLLSALPSATSRIDILTILRTRLLTQLAKHHSCEAILWGDSTTRLAEKTLAETAKGRGFSIPWQTADGMSPYGITNTYPLRDILKKELATYVTLTLPTSAPLLPLCVAYNSQPKYSANAAASGRNITIDELMTQYFETIEEQYPSIVANVVRTAGKLLPPRTGNDLDCRICGLPGDGGGGELTLSALTLNSGVAVKNGREENRSGGVGEGRMCYGCARSFHGVQEGYEWPLDA
ncbi:Cytoplasmic tRNA 2-thiolation protein 2 [Rhizina undulata]